MEINLNSNGFGNVGIDREMPDATGINAGSEKVDKSQTSRDASLRVSNLSSDIKSAGLAAAEPVAEVPESALSRDDELGRIVNAAFSLPMPPMPSFS